MATTVTQIAAKLNALRAKLNAKTGEEDITLSAAVNRVISLSGQGFEDTQSYLPTGYKAMKYLESSGTQYIDTNYLPKLNTTIECTGYWVEQNGDPCPTLFGAEFPNLFVYSNIYLNQITYRFGNSEKINGINSASVPVLYKANKNGLKIKTQDEIDSVQFNNITLGTGENSIFLFAFHSISGSAINYSSSRIYRFKIYEGNELISDLIPCMRQSDNMLGFYDKEQSRFFINSGAGEFSSEEV